jgi:AGCS family alanine or glycine:cation symporter
MDSFLAILSTVNSTVWGPPMLVLILGTGLYLSLGLRGFSITHLPKAFGDLWSGRHHGDRKSGEISPYTALMTSLSSMVGTGNIAGVATAIAIGGPGALFWMWMTALVGMATIYAEAVLAVRYREVNDQGEHMGGPMYYIKNGLGPKWKWLGTLFAFFGLFAAFGIGNTVQGNSVAGGLQQAFDISPWISGFTMMVLVGVVIIGGVRRIGLFADLLVPVMALLYIGSGLVILAAHLPQIPDALALILKSAFTGHAATGGFAGATMIAAIQMGVARGIFSNEAGLGSSPMAHAHAETNNPVRQGGIAMLGVFIDTLIICSITGLVIVISGIWQEGVTGAPLTSAAFSFGLPGYGHYIVSISLAIFAFTTLIGWCVYGECCVSYLLGTRAILPFRILWIMAVPVGALAHLNTVWLLADIMNALMAIPNLIALVLLSPVVFQLTRESLQTIHKQGDLP